MTLTLHTQRLTLCMPTMPDFLAYAAFVTGPRTTFMGGPHDAATAWSWFCNDVAQWPLLNLGALIVCLGDRAIGTTGICHGPNFPEPELGWFLYDPADQGNGFMTEAAGALRDWGFGPRGLPTLVSYIHAANTASARLARRLGAELDAKAAPPAGLKTDVWRLMPGRRA